MTSPRVVVIGDVVTDVVARLAEPPASGSDAAAAVGLHGGGGAANTAAWLAAVGVPTALVARVGDDSLGRERTAELAAAEVDARLAVDPERPTGVIVVVVAPDGERTMFPDRGANLALSPEDVPVELFVPGAHLHLSGYTLLDPGPRPAGLRALELARSAGMTISVDPASAQPLAVAGPAEFLGWTRGADVCLPNLAEARVLTAAEDAEEAADRLTGFYRQAVVTLGADGALWSDGRARVVVRAAGADQFIDSTGAGDAFSAGFLSAWLGGADPQRALMAGCRLAARAGRSAGARPGLS